MLHVDPVQLTSTASAVEAAKGAMEGINATLHSVSGQLQSATALSHEGDVAGDLGSFSDRWQDELGIVGKMLEGFSGALTSAAQAYGQLDEEIAKAIGGA